MENNVESVLNTLSGHVQNITSTKTVIGEEFTIGEYTCKPVMRVGMGFATGVGSGEDAKCKGKGSGTAAGAGIGMCPVGFLVAKGDEISFVPSTEKKGLQAIFEKAPELIEKIIDWKKEKEEKEEKENTSKKKEDK